MLPGSGIAAVAQGNEAGAATASESVDDAQLEAAARQLRRALERCAERFPLMTDVVEEFDDLVSSGAADPLLELLITSRWAQLALVGAGIVVKRLPQFGGEPGDSPPAEVKG